MNTSQPLISIHDLSAGYGEEAILQNVNLEVYPRDFIGLIGPNGGGKSTLLKVILGCIAPTRGQVRVMGQSPQRGRTAIGYVPQFVEVDRAFPISVWDTVRMGLTTGWRLFSRLTRAEAGRIEAALAAVGLLDLRRRSMGELSGGQRQRAFIARALVADPEVLLLDEPTASIDPGVTSEIYDLLGRLNQNLAILLVSHDMLAVTSYTKTIACLNRRLVYHQSKEITPEMLDTTYGCPVELVAHGVPHRVLAQHEAQQHG